MQRNPARVRWRDARVDLIELEDNASSTAAEGDSKLALANLRHAIAALPEGTVMSRLARACERLASPQTIAHIRDSEYREEH